MPRQINHPFLASSLGPTRHVPSGKMTPPLVAPMPLMNDSSSETITIGLEVDAKRPGEPLEPTTKYHRDPSAYDHPVRPFRVRKAHACRSHAIAPRAQCTQK